MRERLAVELTLTLAGTPHRVPAGNVRAIELSLTTYGVTGSVTFIQQNDSDHGGIFEDAVFADFVAHDLGTVAIRIKAVHSETSSTKELPWLETQGVVTEREVHEEIYDGQLADAAALVRRYTVRFADRARALWSQHFPWSLYTGKTLQQALEAEQGSVSLTMDWQALSTVRPMIFLGLRPEHGASFYDFVGWLLAREGGEVFYDHAEGTYKIAGEKPSPGSATKLHGFELGGVSLVLPPVPRSQRRVVNVDADLAGRHPVDAPQAAPGVFHDVVVRAAVSQSVDDRTQRETAVAALPTRVLRVGFRRYPEAPIGVGSVLELPGDSGFSAAFTASAASWRVFALRLSARGVAATPDEGYGEDDASFDVDVAADLEGSADATPRLPPFREPRYPGYVEGRVLSAAGANDELTYEIKQDEAAADRYRVEIPLFDKQEVNPPYQPELSSGTLYLPEYKTARVLLALDFDDCRVVRNLDWRPGARPPAAGQGQQLMLGKKPSNSTSLLHDYESEKPVFQILRTNEKDTLLVRLEEGKMTLKVQERDA